MSLQLLNTWLLAYLIFILVVMYLPTIRGDGKKWRTMVNWLLQLSVFGAINIVLTHFLLGKEGEVLRVLAWLMVIMGFASLTYLIWLVEIMVPRFRYVIRNR